MTATTTRAPIFSKLGTEFDGNDGITASEAMAVVGSDYRIEKEPLLTTKGDPTPFFALQRGPIDGDPVTRILGSCTADYRVTQNEDIADKLDLLNGDMPCVWHGHMDNGGKVFWLLDAGTFYVSGEEHKQFLLVLDNKKGQRSLQVIVSDLRMHCLNAFASFKRNRIISASLQHRAGITDELDFRLKLINQIQKTQSKVHADYEKLAASTITDNEFKAFMASVYPMPKVPSRLEITSAMTPDDLGHVLHAEINNVGNNEREKYEQAVAIIERDRAAVTENFARICDTEPVLAGNRYGALNSITEYIDHLAPRRTNGLQAASSALFGEESKRKEAAFEWLFVN